MSLHGEQEASLPPLGQRLSAFRAVSAAFHVFAEKGYDRMTVPQALFFCAVIEADLMHIDITFTEIREAIGGTISKSLHSTYKSMMEPRGRTNPNGMGWMVAEPNPDDLRERYLRLTPKGHAVANAVFDAVTKLKTY